MKAFPNLSVFFASKSVKRYFFSSQSTRLVSRGGTCLRLNNGSCTLAKFVGKDFNDIMTRYPLPYSPWPSNPNRNDPICVTPPKVAKGSTKQGWAFTCL